MKPIFTAILAVIFFISAGTVNAAKKSVWQPEINIGLISGVPQINLQFSAPCIMIDSATKKQLQKISANTNFYVNVSSLKSNEIEIRGDKVDLKDLRVMINGKNYFGGVKILKRGSTLTVINIAPVEEYLRGVLPKEMIQSWHIEALKAQAVAARTFVLKNRDKHKKDGYELCATTHCQVYNGAETFPNTDRAVAETRGEVLFHGGRTVDAPFHADSGGMTESAANVWGGHVAHLQAISEEIKFTQAWTVKFSVYDFSSRMGAAFGNLQKFNLSPLTIGKSAADRSTSGRVKVAQIVGSKKTVQMRGDEMRRKFSLPSTLFEVKIIGGEVIFTGYGKGHGVGLSQYGAKAYAERGWTYDKILAHYYKNATIKKLY
ncbi:MAG: SpoIID/LytB domain-containing protein [Selenomonadaceae bacterium]|nr:SpoIID/LytB domain-containing protein [Selenomonadaceae bacterium]